MPARKKTIPELLGIEGMRFFGGLWHRPTMYPSDKIRSKCAVCGCLVWLKPDDTDEPWCGCNNGDNEEDDDVHSS